VLRSRHLARQQARPGAGKTFVCDPFMDLCRHPCVLVGALALGLTSASVAVAQQASDGSRSTLGRPDHLSGIRRPDQVRSLQHSDPVIQRALVLVGQPLNPIRVAGPRLIQRLYSRVTEALPPPTLQAFRSGDPRDPLIYVYGRSAVYDDAAYQQTLLADLKLAAVLVHEHVHNTDREPAALRMEADFFRSQLRRVAHHRWLAARRYLGRLDGKAKAFAEAERRMREEGRRARALQASGIHGREGAREVGRSRDRR
jgi:hypothetical protein